MRFVNVLLLLYNRVALFANFSYQGGNATLGRRFIYCRPGVFTVGNSPDRFLAMQNPYLGRVEKL